MAKSNDNNKETRAGKTQFEYDTHLQEVCDELRKMMTDIQASFKERLIATAQLLEIEHLVQHGQDLDKVVSTIDKVAGEGGSIPNAIDQLNKLEKKRNRPSWMNDIDEDDEDIPTDTPEP